MRGLRPILAADPDVAADPGKVRANGRATAAGQAPQLRNSTAIMPVRTTSTAVNSGMPPICPLTPIVIGVVTDFGAIDRMTSWGVPSAQAVANNGEAAM